MGLDALDLAAAAPERDRLTLHLRHARVVDEAGPRMRAGRPAQLVDERSVVTAPAARTGLVVEPDGGAAVVREHDESASGLEARGQGGFQ